MTKTEAGAEEATRDSGSEAELSPEAQGPSRDAAPSPVGSRLAAARQLLEDRKLEGWELPLTILAGVGAVVVAIVGTQTDRLWPWFIFAVLAGATVVAFVLFTTARSAALPSERRTVPGSTTTEIDLTELKQRSEVAPFSVRTSLYSRHLLRLLDRSRPRGQVVVPVSGGHRAQILVEARSEHPVVVQDIRPVVSSRQPTRHGEPVLAAEGALPRQHFDLALDEDPPRLVPAEDPDGITSSLPMTIAPDELELIVLAPRTQDQEVAWYLELDWVCGDRNGTLTVDLGDHPFRVTAETGWTTFYPDEGPSVRTGWD